ncbi:MAG TPA: cytochrome c oxidase subunit II [Candidatus Acidoferrales bacterium]|nr:cytochrome c oxidase subunit II [Candidatus Acidoferrales bacterium]
MKGEGRRAKGLLKALAALLIGAGSGGVQADLRYNMPVGVTEVSRGVHDLHMTMFWICVGIGLLVFSAVIYSIVRFRKSAGAQAANFHENTTVELIWTIIPFAILVAMTIPAAGLLIKMDDTSQPDLTIKITGYQWKWHYDYLDENVSFYSSLAQDSNAARQLGAQIDLKSVDHYLLNVDRPVVVPIGQKIRFLITSNDVIHAWWVPELAVKKDAVPGFINEFWTRIDVPGVYRGQCAELCGRDHGFMPVVVEAKTPEDYAAWLEAQREPKIEPAAASDGSTLVAAR